jgi:DNA-binding beta-propeller fold protein YncE
MMRPRPLRLGGTALVSVIFGCVLPVAANAQSGRFLVDWQKKTVEPLGAPPRGAGLEVHVGRPAFLADGVEISIALANITDVAVYNPRVLIRTRPDADAGGVRASKGRAVDFDDRTPWDEKEKGTAWSKYSQYYLPGRAFTPHKSVKIESRPGPRLIVEIEAQGGPRFLMKFGSYGERLGEFKSPEGIAIDHARGWVYIAEATTQRVQRLDLSGRPIDSFGTPGAGPGQFNHPTGVAVDESTGAVYVADFNNNRVQKFSSKGEHLLSFGSFGSAAGQMNHPVSVAVAPRGEVYVVERDNHRIQAFSPEGRPIRTFGRHGSGPGEFVQPMNVAVDSRGDVLVADTGNHRIQKLTLDGRGELAVRTAWGHFGAGPGEFDYPIGIDFDRDGRIYVGDLGNHRVQVFDRQGRHLVNWGASGLGLGLMNYLYRISIHDSRAYLTEADVNRISVFDIAPLEERLRSEPIPADAPSRGTVSLRPVAPDRSSHERNTSRAVGSVPAGSS